VVLAVGYHLRHHPAHRIARERREELVGALRHVGVRWAWPDPATTGWRARGEGARFWSLAALGTHAIDLALWFAGTRIARVAAVLEPEAGVDRAAEVSLAFEGGLLAHVSVSVTHRAAPRFVLAGERGEIECTGTLGARGDGELAHRPPREAARPIAFTPEDPYRAQLAAFAARVEQGRTGDGDDAVAVENLAVLERAASSGRSP
jgi:predicted dehydrogenase